MRKGQRRNEEKYERTQRSRMECDGKSLGVFAKDRKSDCGGYGRKDRLEQEHDFNDAAAYDGKESDIL